MRAAGVGKKRAPRRAPINALLRIRNSGLLHLHAHHMPCGGLRVESKGEPQPASPRSDDPASRSALLVCSGQPGGRR